MSINQMPDNKLNQFTATTTFDALKHDFAIEMVNSFQFFEGFLELNKKYLKLF